MLPPAPGKVLPPMKPELKKLARNFLLLDAALLLGAVVLSLFGTQLAALFSRWNVCVLHDVFRLYCPGCGGTRALFALFNGHPLRSFLYNPAILLGLCLLLYYHLRAAMALIKKDYTLYARSSKKPAAAFPFVLLGFAVVRNVLLCFFGVDFLGELLVFWR